MIATASAPDNSTAPSSWMIAERTSGLVFDPTQAFDPLHPGKYFPWTSAPADAASAMKFLISPASTCPNATVQSWPGPSAGGVLIWVFLGATVPGECLVAIPYGPTGSRVSSSWDLPMTLQDERRHNDYGGVILDAPGVIAGTPISPTPPPA